MRNLKQALIFLLGCHLKLNEAMIFRITRPFSSDCYTVNSINRKEGIYVII